MKSPSETKRILIDCGPCDLEGCDILHARLSWHGQPPVEVACLSGDLARRYPAVLRLWKRFLGEAVGEIVRAAGGQFLGVTEAQETN